MFQYGSFIPDQKNGRRTSGAAIMKHIAVLTVAFLASNAVADEIYLAGWVRCSRYTENYIFSVNLYFAYFNDEDDIVSYMSPTYSNYGVATTDGIDMYSKNYRKVPSPTT